MAKREQARTRAADGDGASDKTLFARALHYVYSPAGEGKVVQGEGPPAPARSAAVR